MELKHLKAAGLNPLLSASNCTNMELKPGNALAIKADFATSNCTNMELKPYLAEYGATIPSGF